MKHLVWRTVELVIGAAFLWGAANAVGATGWHAFAFVGCMLGAFAYTIVPLIPSRFRGGES